MDNKSGFLISVVMSVYNSDKYLDEAIKSILSQTYTDFEFIIIDDGSTDNSCSIIEKYCLSDSRIVLIKQQNHGLIYSLNKGIKIASGEYIARMDADDISFVDRLETQIAFLNNNPEIGICGTGIELFGDSFNQDSFSPETHEQAIVKLLFRSPLSHPTVMFRRSIIEKHNLNYSADYMHCEDYELWSRWADFSKIANISRVLLKYRIHNQQISVRKSEEMLKNHLKVTDKLLSRLGIELDERQKKVFLVKLMGNRKISELLLLYSELHNSNTLHHIYNADYLRDELTYRIELSIGVYYGLPGLISYLKSELFIGSIFSRKVAKLVFDGCLRSARNIFSIQRKVTQ